jgi:hypothetical protein
MPDEEDSARTLGGGGLPPAGLDGISPEEPNGWYVGPAEDPDRYELLGKGMVGGEGVTWRAQYHGSLGSPLPLAVKVQHRPVDPPPGWPTAQDRSRWRDQTTLLRHVRLEHVVRVNEFTSGPPPHRLGQADLDAPEAIVIEMEWVEGESLATAVRSDPTSTGNVGQRAQWVADACSALAQLHSHSRTAGNPTVHRDVSPANCIVGGDRGLVLIDVTTMQLPRDGLDPAGRHTPAYSAPEVLAMPHKPRLPSADVYSVGALAFFCLTGQDPPLPPPEGIADTRAPILRKAVSRLALDARTVEHVMSMLAADPDRRPHDLLAWGRRFRELATPRRTLLVARTLRRPLVAAPLVLLLAAGVVGGGLLAARDDPRTDARDAGTAPQARAPVEASQGITRTSFSTATGRISSPAPNARVRNCEYFTGTWTPTPGNTIMLAMHNLSESDSVRYVEDVFGYDRPQALSTWRGAQYFNDQSIGQRTVVELVEMPLETAKQLDATDDYLEASRLATTGEVVASVVVVREDRKNPAFPCEGPA